MRKGTKRIYGILLCMSMLLTLLSVPARAAEPVETGAGYEQKQEQQQGQTQNPEHEHTQGCYMLIENCVHEHTLECYPQTTGAGTVSGNDVMETVEDQPTECTHVCSEESGCISRRLSCPFEKESSGELQEETLEESSGINVENALRANGLPIVMAPNNRGDVELKQDTIGKYRESTSGDDIYRLPPGNYRLGENITLDKELKIGEIFSPYTVSLDLNGHKLERGDNVITLRASSELNIKNTGQQEGEIINGSEYGIQINWDAKLRIYGGTIDSIITYYDSAEFYLYGGTIKRNIQFDENRRSIPNAVLYANGGIVEGKLYIWSIDRDKLTIRTEDSAASMTTFRGFVVNCKIEGGIFSGTVDGSCQIENSAKVTVKFDTKGGGSILQQEVLRGQKAQDPGAPVQDGYEFEGWYVSGNPNSKWDFSDNVTDNLNLEAHWNIVYQVTLQTNGGTIAAGKEIKSYTGGTKATLPGGGDITREGYTFEGWYEDSSFSGSPVTEITGSDTGDKIFYAKWSANIYTVKLETNGGKIADGKDVTVYTCGIGAALPTKDNITREGYTYEGWYEDSSFSGSPVTEITGSDTGNKTFYAKWKRNTVPVIPAQTEHNDTNHDNANHDNTGDANESSGTAPVIYPTLTFDTCGGSSIKEVRAFEGHTINLFGYLPTREGYQFSGWYADQNLTQPVTEIRLNGNRTVYAGWIKQAEQAGESSKPKAAPAQLIVNDNEKTANKDSSQPLIEDYEPGSTDTPEDQITEDQSPEDTGDNQKPAVDNSPADNDSEPDDSADLAPENNSHSGGWIPVICISAGALVIGFGTYLGYRRRKKIDKK